MSTKTYSVDVSGVSGDCPPHHPKTGYCLAACQHGMFFLLYSSLQYHISLRLVAT